MFTKVVALVLVAAGAASACGSDKAADEPKPSEAKTFDVSGTLTLLDPKVVMPTYQEALSRCEDSDSDEPCSSPAGEPCAAGSDGYADIAEGAQVVVTDSAGEAVGLGKLRAGESTFVPEVWDTDLNLTPPCVFRFDVDSVPDSGDIYGIQVGHRGIIQFTKAEAEGLAFNLGDD